MSELEKDFLSFLKSSNMKKDNVIQTGYNFQQ